jgi:hypothetical protein
MSLFFKPLSPWLPVDFQFIGIWFLLCFFMQGVFGGLLVREMTRSTVLQLLGACLFVVAPILHARMGHDNLCAHFCLLGLFWLHFRPASSLREAVRLLAWALGFVVFTSGVHPYLNAMVVALALALVVRLWVVDHVLTSPEALMAAGALLGGDVAMLALFGFIGQVPGALSGFGEISADLLTFINPAGRSRLFPYWHLERLKDEGMAYLGLGCLCLIAFALVVRKRTANARAESARGRRLLPLAVVSILLFVFSLANHVTLAGREVLNLSLLYAPFHTVTDSFRASGRFTWSLHYLLLALAIDAVLRGFRQRPQVAAVALAGALGLQLWDIDYKLSLEPVATRFFHFNDAAWALSRGHYAHLALVPAILHDGTWTGCPTPFQEPWYQPIAYEAYRQGMTSNSMYVSRMDRPVALAQCARTQGEVEQANLSKDTLYVVHPSFVGGTGQGLLAGLVSSGRATCGPVDGVPVCVLGSNSDPFAQMLAQRTRR